MNHVDHLVDDYLHDLLDPAETRRVADHVMACDACRHALDQARQRLAAIQSVPATEASPTLVDATVQRVQTEPVTRGRVWRSRLGYALTMLAACVVVLLGTQFYYSGLKANPVDLLVLGQQDFLADAKASLRVRLFDRTAKSALAAIPVSVDLVDPSGSVRSLAEFQTDASGVGQPAFTVPDLPEGSYKLRVTAQTPGKPEVVERAVRVRRSWQVMLSTDKPIYQPGQTIHLRALSLRRPMLLPVANQTATFTLTDSKGNTLFKEMQQTSEYGLAAVDCPLASELPEGAYTLACKIGDSESRQPIPIQKYVLPKFAIAMTWDKPFYAPNEEMVCTVKATYTTGKPVTAGTVELVNFPVKPITTDAQGQAVLRLRAPANRQMVSHVCKVTDPAGQTNSRPAERLVTDRPYRVDLLPENGSLVLGVENTIHVISTRADGQPTPIRLTIEGHLEEITTNAEGIAEFKVTPRNALTLRYTATDDNGKVLDQGERTLSVGQSRGDFLIRSDRVVYQGGQTMKLAVRGDGDEPVFIDLVREGNERYTLRSETISLTNGKGELEIDLNPDLMGTLALLAYRFGSDGLSIQKTRLVQVMPAGELKIEATFDHEEYRPGGEAKLKFRLLDAAGKPRVGALSLAGVDEAVYALLAVQPGSERKFFTLDAKALNAVTSRFSWNPVVKPAQADQSRDQAIFSVAARTAVGTPRGEQPNRGRERFIEEDSDGSMPVPQPTNSLGLLSLEANSFQAKFQQVAQLQRMAWQWIVLGWVALGLVAAVLAYSCIWIFMPLREALALHAGIGLIAVPAIMVLMLSSSAMERGMRFDAVSSAIGGSDGFAAAKEASVARNRAEIAFFDSSRSMETKDSSPMPRVRDYFPETLLWRPELVTNAQGEATLTLPLADSITTWRISASAVDGQGRLGSREMPLRVFQPFFVDFNLPIALTRNDQVSIPVVVSSYLDRPQTVRLTLKKADWFELLAGEEEQSVEILPGQVKAVTYRIAVRKTGTRELEVMAKGGDVGDAVRRPIEVLADGRPVDLTASGSLETPYTAGITLPENAIEGSGRLIVKVYPSRFSQVVEGLDNIFRMPYGCFEQTSSSTYPNILALDYLQRTRQDRPEIAAKAKRYIALGYQRLIGFEVAGGGFEWFGQGTANTALSAYGLMEFEDMSKVYSVDRQIIDRTRTFLLNQRQSDGSWPADNRMARTGDAQNLVLSTTAYVAWSVFGDGRARESIGSTRDYLVAQRPDAITSSYTLALVANALLAIDPSGSAAMPYLDRLLTQAIDGPDGQAYWQLGENARTTFHGAGQAGNIETSALATLALIQSKMSPETVRRGLAWLVAQKDRNGTWHSTQATVLSLRTLLAASGSEAEPPKDRTIQVKLGEYRHEIRVPKEKAEVMQWLDLTAHLQAGKQTLEVSEPTKTGAGYQVDYRYHVPGERANAGSLALAAEYAQTDVLQGASVSAVARIRNSPDRAAVMLLVEVPIPAGFRARGEDFASMVEKKLIARYQIEGTRVLLYLREMAKNARLELPYLLEAVQVVETQTVPGRVYEYYDPAREAFSTPTKLRVTGR